MSDRLVMVVPFIPECAIDTVDDVARLFDFQIDHRIHRSLAAVVIIGELIPDGRDELIACHQFDELRVLRRLTEQTVLLRFHVYDRERERREGMRDKLISRRTDEIGERTRYLMHAVPAGYVLVTVPDPITRISVRIVVS